MVSKQEAINMWKKEISSLKGQIRYCQNQIKKNPAKWEIKEYRTVIKNAKKKIAMANNTIKKIKKLS